MGWLEMPGIACPSCLLQPNGQPWSVVGPSPAPGTVPMGSQALRGQGGRTELCRWLRGMRVCNTPHLSHREGLADVLHRIVQLTQEDDCVSPACPQPSHPCPQSPSTATVPGSRPNPSQRSLGANLPSLPLPFKSFCSYFPPSEADAQAEKRELFPFIWESGSRCLARGAEEMLGVTWLQPRFPKKTPKKPPTPLSSPLPARDLS